MIVMPGLGLKRVECPESQERAEKTTRFSIAGRAFDFEERVRAAMVSGGALLRFTRGSEHLRQLFAARLFDGRRHWAKMSRLGS
jgi:hypothetical protein